MIGTHNLFFLKNVAQVNGGVRQSKCYDFYGVLELLSLFNGMKKDNVRQLQRGDDQAWSNDCKVRSIRH